MPSGEGDEVFWVGLVVVEHYKHVGTLLDVHQAVEAVRGVRATRRRGVHLSSAHRVSTGQDTGDVQAPQAGCVPRAEVLGRILCVDSKVNSFSMSGSCGRIT